jgi:hypothetical protein
MEKPLIRWEWVDHDPAKKIFGCTFLVLMLISAAVIKQAGWTNPFAYALPSLLLLPMMAQYWVWRRKGGKLPNFTLNSEGFCIGNHWSFFSLNAGGKRKWGKPHLFLWKDIQLIELDDRDPEVNVFSWTLKPGVKTPDAPNHFLFGPDRDQTYFDYEEEKEGSLYDEDEGSLYEEEDCTLAMRECYAEEALELMVLLMVAKEEDDRRSVLENWKTMSTPNRSIEDLDPEERKAAEALIKERDQLITDAGDLELHHDMDTESVNMEELGDLFTRGMETNRVLREQNITPPRPKCSLGVRIQLILGAIITIAIVIALIFGFIMLLWEAFFVN